MTLFAGVMWSFWSHFVAILVYDCFGLWPFWMYTMSLLFALYLSYVHCNGIQYM